MTPKQKQCSVLSAQCPLEERMSNRDSKQLYIIWSMTSLKTSNGCSSLGTHHKLIFFKIFIIFLLTPLTLYIDFSHRNTSCKTLVEQQCFLNSLISKSYGTKLYSTALLGGNAALCWIHVVLVNLKEKKKLDKCLYTAAQGSKKNLEKLQREKNCHPTFLLTLFISSASLFPKFCVGTQK